MPRRKAPIVPVITTTIGDNTHVAVTDPGLVETVARLLLEAAGNNPECVRTVTGPDGWVAPTKLVKAARLL